jgi:hypothetical protein
MPESGNARRNRVCSTSNSTAVTVYPNMCGSEEECFINEDWSGTCEVEVDRNFDLILYPGYRWRGDEVFGTCFFGSKICNSNDRCEGFPAYSGCRRSSDCNFGNYCSEDGLWLPLNENLEQWTTHDSWEKNNFWFFHTPTDKFGTWVEIGSRDERELVLPQYNRKPVAQEDMEKLCRSGMVNRTTGRWATKLKSTRKGQIWITDADCPTSDPNVFAAWKCGFNSAGDNYCDIEAGDDEWEEATKKFQEYSLLSLGWHTAEGYREWGQKDKNDNLSKEYKWAEYKAKNYVSLLNNPPCLQSTYKYNPHFWEYNLYWSAFTLPLSMLLLLPLFSLLF